VKGSTLAGMTPEKRRGSFIATSSLITADHYQLETWSTTSLAVTTRP
jgi:hypothetical protein